MRTFAIVLLVGIVCLTGCSHASSALPQLNGIAQSSQTRSVESEAAPPTHYRVMYRFNGAADGGKPLAGLVRDSSGNLYGTTERGGSPSSQGGRGVVFKVDPSGSESVLHTFTGPPDGKLPRAGLILDTSGNLYGTTIEGGPTYGGTVFKLDPSGHETLLYGWAPALGFPAADLIADAAGNLYGTAEYGGNAHGSVFKIDTSGNYTDLFSFDVTNGYRPHSQLVRDSAGNLYGTTIDGGSVKCGTFESCGLVFEIDTNGNEIILHNFAGGTDGEYPYAGVLRDGAGNLYGTTRAGGSAGGCSIIGGCGVLFKLDSAGNETILFRFKGKSGENPVGDLVRDSAGDFFGTTSRGGSLGLGTVFELDRNGNETVLHSFDSADGGPLGGVVRDENGDLYGTAQYGSGNGVVFKIVH
jgi:uncharacterized repeat protein (TIGR03803 family)